MPTERPFTRLPVINFRKLYDRFNAPVTDVDCGMMCAPHNPSGKPFCCDICQAVPAAYHTEWRYLRDHTALWREWGVEDSGPAGCPDPGEVEDLRETTPDTMLLLACRGPHACERDFRALSCRQFPFFPYITADGRFIGLAYEWAFEPVCWVISHLGRVSDQYRIEFIAAYDELFNQWPHEMENYAALSEEMRAQFSADRRRIPVFHRRGGWYLLSPSSERLTRIDPQRLPKFGPYRTD